MKEVYQASLRFKIESLIRAGNITKAESVMKLLIMWEEAVCKERIYQAKIALKLGFMV